jgi:hypothetical protein
MIARQISGAVRRMEGSLSWPKPATLSPQGGEGTASGGTSPGELLMGHHPLLIAPFCAGAIKRRQKTEGRAVAGAAFVVCDL